MSFQRFMTVACVVFVMSVGVRVFAQDTKDLMEMSLEDLLNIKIEVSSTKGEDLFSSTSTVSVIDAEMIKHYHFRTVSEAVQTVAGFAVMRTYLKRSLPTSRGILQDHYANKVLVLINNTPTWNAVTGEPALDRVAIQDVERIEVLKGPASVLYGTNAYSGAVNIVLKEGGKNKTVAAHAGLGAYAAYDAGFGYGNKNEKASIFVSGHLANSTGKPYSFTDENRLTGEYHEFENTNSFVVNAKLKNHEVLFNGFVNEESFLGVVPQFSGGAGRSQTSKGYLISYSNHAALSAKADLESGVTVDWNHRDFPRTMDDSIRAKVEGARVLGFVKSQLQLSPALTVDLGADYEYRKSIEYVNYNAWSDVALVQNNMKDKSIDEYSFFGQLGYNHKAFNLLLGSRFTHNDLFGSNISARGTLVYSINKKNSLKFIFGQSFRAPALFELYFETPTYTVFGNTELKPEKSNSFELAYLTSFDKIYLQVLGYYSQYDDKIFRDNRRVVRPDTVFANKSIYVNGARFEAKGVEVEFKYIAPKILNAFFNYSFVDGDNGDEINNNGNYNFKYVPKHTITGGLSKTISRVRVSALAHYLSKRSGPFAEIDGQYVVDANIGFSQKFQDMEFLHTLFIKNIFDEDVQVPEYVSRRRLNSITLGNGRIFGYALQFSL